MKNLVTRNILIASLRWVPKTSPYPTSKSTCPKQSEAFKDSYEYPLGSI